MPARYVLVCEDDDGLGRAAFEQLFRADAEERARTPQIGAPRWFELDGQVCGTLAELRDSLEEGVAAGTPPHLVLIDDRLPSARGGEPVRSALKAVRLITAMFGPARPRCVLHTSDLKPNDVWAFLALGGHNAIDKFRPHTRMPILWETLDGAVWTPPQRTTDISITDANGRLLPYMECSHWKYNARIDLADLAPADVKKADTRLDKAKSRLVSAFSLETGAEAREIVAAANAHGLVWVPLSHRHLLDEDHPEHRASAFRHRLPPARPA